MINHLFSIEESNLFKIKHLEDSEQTLEKIKEQSKRKIDAAQFEIDKVEKNIAEQQKAILRLTDKKKYFEQNKMRKPDIVQSGV